MSIYFEGCFEFLSIGSCDAGRFDRWKAVGYMKIRGWSSLERECWRQPLCTRKVSLLTLQVEPQDKTKYKVALFEDKR